MKYSFEEKKRRICIIAICLFVVIAGIIYYFSNNVSDSSESDEYIYGDDIVTEAGNDNESEVISVDSRIVVHVCGAVKSPGVYELEGNPRVSDAIEAAGGFAKKAATDYLNLAEPVSDGQKITVVTKSQAKRLMEPQTDNTGSSSDSSGRMVNINTAGAEELMTLPGIGQSKAESIIQYREDNGGFSSISDIKNIPGIKEGVYSKISKHITV